MAITAFIGTARTRPELLLAGFGLLSGVLSATFGLEVEATWLRAPGRLFFLDPGSVPIGIFYAVALAAGLWVATGRALIVPVALLGTLYAWSAALQTASMVVDTTSNTPRLILASLLAGAVGAGLTQLAAALVLPDLRPLRRAAVTVAVGAVLGLLYVLGDRQIIDLRILFLAWQPAVAWCIGAGLSARSGA